MSRITGRQVEGAGSLSGVGVVAGRKEVGLVSPLAGSYTIGEWRADEMVLLLGVR